MKAKRAFIKTIQPKAAYLPEAPSRTHLLRLPFVARRGRLDSHSRPHNFSLAAIHSLVAGIRVTTKRDARYWLETAQSQLDGAVDSIKRRRPRGKGGRR